jgi:hypothetical protein
MEAGSVHMDQTDKKEAGVVVCRVGQDSVVGDMKMVVEDQKGA